MCSNPTNRQHDQTKTFMRLLFANDRRIYAYISVLVADRADAEDIFQETLSIMWGKFDTFQLDRDFGAWGIGIAYNLIRNYRRKQSRSHLYFEEDIEKLLEPEARQSLAGLDCRIEALQKCLTYLNQMDRKIIQLRYEEEISVETIARKVGKTIKSIYVKLSRANSLLLSCVRRTLAEQDL